MQKAAVAKTTDLQSAIEKIAHLEKQLAEKEYLLEQIADELNNGYWYWQIESNNWHFSLGFCQLLGYNEDDLSNDLISWKKLLPSPSYRCFQNYIDGIRQGKFASFSFSMNMLNSRGKELRVCSKGQVIEWDAAQKPIAVVGTVEIKEEGLKNDSQFEDPEVFRHYAQIIPGSHFFMFDRNLKYTLAEGSDLLPGEKDKFVGKTLFDLQTPQEVKILEPCYRAVLNGQVIERELAYRGSSYYVKIIPIASAGEEVEFGFVFAINVSKIKNAENQLSAFIKQAPVAMAIFDTSMRYITVSKQWMADYGIEDDTIIGKSHYDVFPEENPVWKDIHQACLKGEVKRQDEDRMLLEDGTERWIRWEVRPWYKEKSQIGGLMMTTEDITQRKLSELSLKRHQNGLKILTAISSNHQLSLNEQLQEVLLSVADYFDLPLGIISHITNTDYQVEYAISRDDEIQIEGTQFEYECSYCSITYELEDTIAIQSMMDSKYVSHPCYRKFQMEAYIGSPIWVSGKKYGAISFTSPEKRLVQFTQEDIDFMHLVARWVGTTLERYANERQLVAARREAEEATQAKTDFLSTMSHEIRTPMNAVVGMAHLLLEEEPREDQINSLQTLKFSADLLLSLINDILDFSKIEAGKISLESIDFNLKDLMQGIKSAQGIKAQEKQVKMKLRWDDDVPEMVVGDPVRLGQIINNLTSNAVKFTSKGQVSIDVELKEETSDTIMVQFEVHDTGIGIAEDKIVTIFEEFSQASSSTTRKFGGTGLGLAITKKLLELQESEIQVKSEEGVGSNFYFILKLGKSRKKAISSNNFSVDSGENYMGNLRGARVLLVEDNFVNQYVAARFIVKWQVELDTADNGADAVAKVQKNNYDLVLMDLQMPMMDGIEATKNIRVWETETNRVPTPIIALTASVESSTKDYVLSVGMNDFISKPFVPQELFSRMQHYLEREDERPIDSPLADPYIQMPTEEPEVSAVQYHNINTELLEQLAEGELTEMLDLCNNYEEMILKFVEELTAYTQNSDIKMLRESIHRVKSTFQMFGAKSINQLLEQVSDLDEESNASMITKTIDQCNALKEELLQYKQAFTTR
uniref:histidine kinase n=1 Tax=Roseihalotalea indica TaxID=2867963 RepID=A0AA49GP03_9BACT|nr:ATP-binding protein [Tunicatimonas sp. TK19036]